MEVTPVNNPIGIKEAAGIYARHSSVSASYSTGKLMFDPDRAEVLHDLKKELLRAIDAGQWEKADHIIKLLQQL